MILMPIVDGCDLPKEISKIIKKRNMDYYGIGILSEMERFAIIDGKFEDVFYNQNNSSISGKSGWVVEKCNNPILLYFNDNSFLVFVEPGLYGSINGEKYKLIYIERLTGKIIFEKAYSKNPKSIMIKNSIVYILKNSSSLQVECIHLDKL